MRIKKLLLLPILIMAVACNNNKPVNPNNIVDEDAKTQSTFKEEEFIPPAPSNNINTFNSSFSDITTYYWVGMFGDVNKISVKIQEMNDDKTVKGFSVAAGQIRPFSGTFTTQDKKSFSFEVKEPGDDKYDGSFQFTIANKTLKGSWQPFDASKTTAKKYTLVPRIFKYDANVGGDQYDFTNASKKLLKDKDVNNLTKEDLRYIRSEIYARHGYAFKMKDIRSRFDYIKWYMPVSTDVRKDLTPLEKKNIALINRYEKYAKEYYDDYGR